MSGRSLVVHQSALQAMADTLREATESIETFMTELNEVVESQTAGWTEETPSRVAQRSHEKRLTADVTALREALGRVADALDDHRDKTHDTEVKNVAIIG